MSDIRKFQEEEKKQTPTLDDVAWLMQPSEDKHQKTVDEAQADWINSVTSAIVRQIQSKPPQKTEEEKIQDVRDARIALLQQKEEPSEAMETQLWALKKEIDSQLNQSKVLNYASVEPVSNYPQWEERRNRVIKTNFFKN